MQLEQPNDSTFAPSSTENQIENFKEHFVGDGKKYATDEDAMKGLFFANQHIDKIEKENQEAQGELKLRESVEKILEARGQTLATSQEITPEGNAPAQEENTTPASTATPSEKDLSELIRNVVSEDQREARKTANYTEAVQKLDVVFGSRENANTAVMAKAAELGVGIEMFMETAEQSPEAFYSLMGLTSTAKQSKTNVSPSQSSVSTEAFNSTHNSSRAQEGTYAFYEEMRKSDPKKFDSSAIQSQMNKDAQAAPDKFFGRS